MDERHLDSVPEAEEGDASGSPSVWRDIVLASVVAGILFLGIAGGAVAPNAGAEFQIPPVPAQPEPPAAREPRAEAVHFQTQETIPTF